MSQQHLLPMYILACVAAVACGGADGSELDPENCSTSPADNPDDKGALMRPGGNCISCHQQEGGPSYTIAGTVMGDYADDANCEGIEDAIVEITGADGKVLSLETNAVGNFTYTGNIAKPYTARVLAEGLELAMIAPQTDGNCANCHTEVGASGAPGRILSPELAEGGGGAGGGATGEGGEGDAGGGGAGGAMTP